MSDIRSWFTPKSNSGPPKPAASPVKKSAKEAAKADEGPKRKRAEGSPNKKSGPKGPKVKSKYFAEENGVTKKVNAGVDSDDDFEMAPTKKAKSLQSNKNKKSLTEEPNHSPAKVSPMKYKNTNPASFFSTAPARKELAKTAAKEVASKKKIFADEDEVKVQDEVKNEEKTATPSRTKHDKVQAVQSHTPTRRSSRLASASPAKAVIKDSPAGSKSSKKGEAPPEKAAPPAKRKLAEISDSPEKLPKAEPPVPKQRKNAPMDTDVISKKAVPKADPPKPPAKADGPVDKPDKPKPRFYPGMIKERSGSMKGVKSIPIGTETALKDMTIVVTGDLESFSRDEFKEYVTRHGGRFTGSVSGKTSYLVIGDDPGTSKVASAEAKKVKQIKEDDLFDVVVKNSKGKVTYEKNGVPQGPPADDVKDSVDEKFAAVAAKPSPTAPATSGTQEPKKDDPARIGKAAEKKAAPVEALPAIPRPVAPESSVLWTTKHKPSKIEEIVGNPGLVRQIGDWLSSWERTFLFGNAGSSGKVPKGDEPKKAILLSGPPGLGKTTAAHLVAKSKGYAVVEFNASDTRSKKSLQEQVEEMVGNRSLTEFFGKKGAPVKAEKSCLVMDEVDGMSAGDRGGVAEVINIIKKTKIPIICICNDRYNQKLKSLVNYCLDLKFHRPTVQQLMKRMKDIAQKEGLNMSDAAMTCILESSGGDIRNILNAMQMMRVRHTNVSYDTVKSSINSNQKDVDVGIFDIASKLLGSAGMSLSFNDRMDLYFEDPDLVPLFVAENYVNCKPFGVGDDLDRLERLSQAADMIAYGDVVNDMVRGQQAWSLMPVHGVLSSVGPASIMRGSRDNLGNMYDKFWRFPQFLGKLSKGNKHKRILAQLHSGMTSKISSTGTEVRLSYFSALREMLTLPLVKKEADGIAEVISVMEEYGITRDDWDCVNDLTLFMKDNGRKVGDYASQIPTKIKSAFTRQYNQGHIALKSSRTNIKKGGDDDDEDGEENTGAVDEVALDSMIKQAKPKGAKKGATGGGRGGSSATRGGGSGRGRGRGRGRGK